jgi:hypothetical protein
MTVHDSYIVAQAFSLHLQPERLHHMRTIPHGHLAAISLVMSSRSFNLGCMRFELPIAGDEQSER